MIDEVQLKPISIIASDKSRYNIEFSVQGTMVSFTVAAKVDSQAVRIANFRHKYSVEALPHILRTLRSSKIIHDRTGYYLDSPKGAISTYRELADWLEVLLPEGEEVEFYRELAKKLIEESSAIWESANELFDCRDPVVGDLLVKQEISLRDPGPLTRRLQGSSAMSISVLQKLCRFGWSYFEKHQNSVESYRLNLAILGHFVDRALIPEDLACWTNWADNTGSSQQELDFLVRNLKEAVRRIAYSRIYHRQLRLAPNLLVIASCEEAIDEITPFFKNLPNQCNQSYEAARSLNYLELSSTSEKKIPFLKRALEGIASEKSRLEISSPMTDTSIDKRQLSQLVGKLSPTLPQARSYWRESIAFLVGALVVASGMAIYLRLSKHRVHLA